MGYLTVANQLTILRIVLVPVFALLVVYGHLGWALVSFLGAGVTDALDGLIARRAGQRTELGAWLDPMADKLLVATTFVILTLPDVPLTNHLPLWLTVFVLSRDVVIVGVVGIVSLVLGPRDFKPSLWGKLATAMYVGTSVVVMYYNYLGQRAAIIDVCIWLSMAITVVSGVDYFARLRRLINEPGPAAVGGR